MSHPPKEFDFWYAVNNTEVLELPLGRLETFGSTLIHYCLVTELMDAVGQIRIREGRIQAFRPEILTPQSFLESPLETGFRAGPADDFVRWLRFDAAEPNKFAPVLLTAAHTMISDVRKSRDCGGHFVIAKPIAPIVMLERIIWVARGGRSFLGRDQGRRARSAR